MSNLTASNLDTGISRRAFVGIAGGTAAAALAGMHTAPPQHPLLHRASRSSNTWEPPGRPSRSLKHTRRMITTWEPLMGP